VLDWNAIATTRPGRFNRAASLLRHHAQVERSGLYNVLLVRAPEPRRLLADLSAEAARERDVTSAIAHVLPVTDRFSFESAEDLERKAGEVLVSWLPELAGKSFHVRMHRRGLKGAIARHATEKRLAERLLAELDRRGTPGCIGFDDPDAIVSVETVRDTCGLALWSRADLERFPRLRGAFHLRSRLAAVVEPRPAPP
jgi:tRNA(Ser,Leu) C12 N-acetylase TAN1